MLSPHPVVASALSAADEPAAPIAAAIGQRRLLIVFAPDAEAPALVAQRTITASSAAAFAERDLSVIEVVGASVQGAADRAADLRRRFQVAPEVFRAVLIGKDGGTKLTSATPLSGAQLSTTIDAMPMRRDEVRHR